MLVEEVISEWVRDDHKTTSSIKSEAFHPKGKK
jgi:hypothetical protein